MAHNSVTVRRKAGSGSTKSQAPRQRRKHPTNQRSETASRLSDRRKGRSQHRGVWGRAARSTDARNEKNQGQRRPNLSAKQTPVSRTVKKVKRAQHGLFKNLSTGNNGLATHCLWPRRKTAPNPRRRKVHRELKAGSRQRWQQRPNSVSGIRLRTASQHSLTAPQQM